MKEIAIEVGKFVDNNFGAISNLITEEREHNWVNIHYSLHEESAGELVGIVTFHIDEDRIRKDYQLLAEKHYRKRYLERMADGDFLLRLANDQHPHLIALKDSRVIALVNRGKETFLCYLRKEGPVFLHFTKGPEWGKVRYIHEHIQCASLEELVRETEDNCSINDSIALTNDITTYRMVMDI